MKEFTIRQFECTHRDKENALIISIYLFRSDISQNQLDSSLSDLLANGSQYDGIHFVGMRDCISLSRTWLTTETSILGRLTKVLSSIETDTCFISFDDDKGQHCAQTIHGKECAQAEYILALHKKYSLLELFTAGNGFKIASNEYHYIKPSKRHAGAFIRTANVLELSGATNIIAFWLLPLVWKSDIRYIVVDTSGIAALGLTLISNALYYGGIKIPPLVSSHQSYGGLKHIKISNPSETLILISATTSGGLKDELIDLGASNENIHTIFYLGNDVNKAGNVLCNLTKTNLKDKYGLDVIKNYIQSNCPYCTNKSYPIALIGDQFSPEPAKVEEIEINFPDLPPSQQAIIEKLAGLNLFKTHKNVDSRRLEYYLDTSTLFRNESNTEEDTNNIQQEVIKRWKTIVTRSAPVTLNRMVHAEYPFSKQLTELSKHILVPYTDTSQLNILSSRELRSSSTTEKMSTLVISSCIDDSQELMGINRDLRSIQPYGNTSYISPIFRATSHKERERIRANLTYGENGKDTFSLHTIYKIDLPEEIGTHSWLQEIDLMAEVLEWIDIEGRARPIELENRLIFLRNAPTIGISDCLFWKNQWGNELSIRPDFTLLKVDGGKRQLSQADIFFVISAVLHNLRNGVQGKPKLEYKTYSRAVISPDNFQRLNDGVIQAAILRAARKYELSYSTCDANTSSRMKDQLIAYANKSKEGEGEALIEFLIAIAAKKMTLHPEHTKEITDAILSNTHLPNYYGELSRFIKSQISNNST